MKFKLVEYLKREKDKEEKIKKEWERLEAEEMRYARRLMYECLHDDAGDRI